MITDFRLGSDRHGTLSALPQCDFTGRERVATGNYVETLCPAYIVELSYEIRLYLVNNMPCSCFSPFGETFQHKQNRQTYASYRQRKHEPT